MVKFKSVLVLMFGLTLTAGCDQIGAPAKHSNPFDSIYDSGDFRVVLKQVGNKLVWSDVFHRDLELEDEEFQVNGGDLSTAADQATAILVADQMRAGEDVTNGTVLQAGIISSTDNALINGEYSPVTAGTYYFLELNVTLNGVTSNIYSNIVLAE